MFRRLPPLLLALTGLVLAGGCGKDSTTNPASPGTVVIQFDNTVDGQPLQMNNQIYTNAAGNVYAVSNLEYSLSDIHLHPTNASDPDVQLGAVYYRTEADPSTRSVTYTDIPAGSYKALGITFGIAKDQNISGAFPSLDAVGMAWPAQMGGGYHYMRCEGTFDGTNGYATHTGPSGGNDYSIQFDLTANIQVVSGKTTIITVQMNVNEWYANPNVYDFNDHMSGIMGDQATQALLQQNGVDVLSILTVTME